MSAGATLDPNRVYCPHCGAENPPYVFVLQQAGTPIGALQYFTIACGAVRKPPDGIVGAPAEECRRILGIALTAFEPRIVGVVGSAPAGLRGR